MKTIHTISLTRLGAALVLVSSFGMALPTQSEPRAAPGLPPSDHNEPLVVTPAQAGAVKRGLAWLAQHQNTDGSWTAKIGYKLNNDYNYISADRGHVGVTSLACMAFLAGGHLPGRGEYGEVVERGLGFILGSVQEDGYITRHRTRMYSHAFATLFLAEIYGTTRREDVKQKLQKAIDYIVESQNRDGATSRTPSSRTCRSWSVRSWPCGRRATSEFAYPRPRWTARRSMSSIPL